MIDLKAYIRDVPDFPKPGIIFRDIAPLIASPEAMDEVVYRIAHMWQEKRIDVIAGLDARGFIFGARLAHLMHLPLAMVRKKGKLPPPTVSHAYELEYGTDVIEIQPDAFPKSARVLVVDDLLATGGTAAAACVLINKVGAHAVGCAFVTELVSLGGRKKLAVEVQSLVKY